MRCPSCKGPFISKSDKNYINQKDENGRIKAEHQLLSEFIPVYKCDTCGVIWPREPDHLI